MAGSGDDATDARCKGAVMEVVMDMVRGIADARSRIRQGRKGFVPNIRGGCASATQRWKRSDERIGGKKEGPSHAE